MSPAQLDLRTHLCLDCRGTQLPEERMGEDHVAVRFGDHASGWRVYFQEVEMANWTTEAFAGRDPDGWVLRLCTEQHPCEQCGRQACQWLAHGNVRVERAQ